MTGLEIEKLAKEYTQLTEQIQGYETILADEKLVLDIIREDIYELKEKYGEKLCLIGNIDLHYTLTRGTTDDVTSEVEERIRAAGKNGGYIISSAMTLADYCKPENVLAMADAIKDYGEYPISK